MSGASISSRVAKLAYLRAPDKIAAHIRHDTGRACSVEQVERLLKDIPEGKPNGRRLGPRSRHGSEAINTSSAHKSAVIGSRALLVAIAVSRLKTKRLPKGHRAYWQHVIETRGEI